MGWVSPTGHNDPDVNWISQAFAYDDDTSSFAYVSDPISLSYLELTLISAITCDKVQIFIDSGSVTTNIDIDVYYDDGWHNIFSGVVAKGVWVEKPVGSIQSISKARFKSNEMFSSFFVAEFDFWEVLPPAVGRSFGFIIG